MAAIAVAWRGSVGAIPFQQYQLLPSPPPISRQCCSYYGFVSQPAVVSSSINASWTGKIKKNLFGAKVRASEFTVRAASQEAGTSTLLVQEVEFIWKGKGAEVLLTGDFLEWQTKVPLEKGADGFFILKKKLPIGKFAYKFVVDGEWMHSADSPTVPDGTGGFNNEVIVADPSSSGTAAPTASTDAPKSQPLESPTIPKDSEPAKPKPAGAKDPAAKPARASKKAAVVKSLEATMVEDVIPQLTSALEKEEGLTDLDITFEDNQLKTSFTKGAIPYCHWAFFPDGTLDGSRGASLTSHGSPPSTIEPFLVDENKISPELVVFWIRKRLFAQKILSVN